MKFQNSIIASLLVSFVCAAPFVEGRDDKAAVSTNAKNLESESTNFENVGFVPRSVLRKRETETKNDALKSVDELYAELVQAYNLDLSEVEEKMQGLDKKLTLVQEIAKTAKDGALGGKVAYIEKLIEGFKELIKMEKIIDGCDYPGSELVIDILELKVHTLLAGSLQGEIRARRIAESEKNLQFYQNQRETEYGEDGEDEEDMLPGLRKVFDAQSEKVKEIIKDLKEDERSEKELTSGTDAAHDDEKCPEIVWDEI
ncbi:hypothetical protein OXX59_007992 [Metschnikowia pulcherrima]